MTSSDKMPLPSPPDDSSFMGCCGMLSSSRYPTGDCANWPFSRSTDEVAQRTQHNGENDAAED